MEQNWREMNNISRLSAKPLEKLLLLLICFIDDEDIRVFFGYAKGKRRGFPVFQSSV